MNVIVLPVQASTPAGEWTDDEYHEEYEDLSDCPKYSKEDLVYTGELSQNVKTDFNLLKQYGMGWCKDTGFYMSRPFEFRYRWDYGSNNSILNFGKTMDSAYHQMFTEEKFHGIFDTYLANNNLSLDDYDVYYMVRQAYNTVSEYGALQLYYYLVPKGARIAMSNENKPDGSSDYNLVKYGLCLDDMAFSSCIYGGCYINGETQDVWNVYCSHFEDSFYSFLGRSHNGTIATNIPIFTKQSAAENYVENGSMTEDPSNKFPDESKEKVGADAFYWDSLDCKLSRVGNQYKFIFDYSYSASDMVANPDEYIAYVTYTQTFKYKKRSSDNIVDDKSQEVHSSFNLDSSPGRSVDNLTQMSANATNAGEKVVLAIIEIVSTFFGNDTDWLNIDFYNSYITVYVELVHTYPSDGGLAVKDKVSSDVRSFSFDAMTLKSIDDTGDVPSTPNDVIVKTNDTVDSSGKVIDRTVESVVVNDNSTHTTINNYYYDSDGNKSTTPNGSSSGSTLSDILSGLIDFIKTLVTEGLPAAVEILTTVIEQVVKLVSSVVSDIGDIGSGTSNGIIAVFKALPASLWAVVALGVVVFVIGGVIKHIIT